MPFASFAAIGSSTRVTLMQAILIYKLAGVAGNNGSPLATVHEVGFEAGNKPVIMPGEPITAADVEALTQLMSKAATSMSYLPANVLSITANRLVWHIPSRRARIWFNAEAKAYRHLNGKEVTHPALVFDATINAGLRILALAGDSRPLPETPIYRAPYMNLYSLGEMCRGNSPMPKVFTPEAIRMFEDSFFRSAFSHTNLAGKSMCRHPQGPVKMWGELRTLQKFPVKWLAPLSRAKGDRAHHDDSRVQTVGDLLRPQKWTGHHPL